MARLPRAKALWRPSESRTSARSPAAGELGYRQRALGAGDPTAPACSVSRRATPVPTSWAFRPGPARSSSGPRSSTPTSKRTGSPTSSRRDAATTRLLRVRCLVDGRPVANQMLLWGGEQRGRTLAQRGTRTGPDGVAEVTLDAAGRWYVKFVHMVRATERGLDYESKWATVTFETR